jgi:hypothetical protein
MRPAPVARAAALALVCFALAGCSSNNKGKIEGTKWVSIAQTVKGLALPEGALALEFKSDGKVVYKAGPQTYTGSYKLGSGDTVTLNLDQELSGRKKHQQRVQINGNELKMIDGDGTTGVFKKVS